jgi:hypothetical protein
VEWQKEEMTGESRNKANVSAIDAPSSTACEPRRRTVIARIALFAACALLFCATAPGQVVTDKMVATVSAGVRPELITYSDLVWQLALEPGSPMATPASDRLNQVLQRVIDQRLILQEAERLPAVNPAPKEIDDSLAQLISRFPSQTEFYERIQQVGLSSEQLREIIRQRLEIEKYLDFRFRSFTVVSPKEVTDYYNEVFVPRFRRQQPGRIVPTLEEVRSEIEKTLIETRIASDTDQFIENLRERGRITILNPV